MVWTHSNSQLIHLKLCKILEFSNCIQTRTHPYLKVGQGRAAPGGVGHDPEPLVDESLVPELLEDPPDGLHVPWVEGLVVVLKVDPPKS